MSIHQVLLNQVISVIRNSVNLHHLELTQFNPETSLCDGGLGLDSVDILEIIVAVEHHFGVKVDAAEIEKKHFCTIGSLAELISLKRKNRENLTRR
jgi:acyl carrier protein